MPGLAALANQNEVECFAHLTRRDQHILKRILKETVARLGLTSILLD